MLEFLVLTTVFCGFLGILWQNNLINKVIAMDAMSSGVVAYFVLMARPQGKYLSPSPTTHQLEPMLIPYHRLLFSQRS